jgi:hypothetical protein
MTSFDPDRLSRYRARRNAAAVNRGKAGNSYGSGYVRDSLRQCPKHHVDYVLRRSTRESPALLIYDCPEPGCFITLQVSSKR